MLRIALLYLILCITAILPVLSVSDTSNYKVPTAIMDSPSLAIQKLNLHVLSRVEDEDIRQFIIARARQECENYRRDKLEYVGCLRQTISPDVGVVKRPKKFDDITHTSIEIRDTLLKVQDEDLRNFILLRAQMCCDEFQLEKAEEKEACLSTHIHSDVNVATRTANGDKEKQITLRKRMVGKKMLGKRWKKSGRKPLSLTN